MVQFNPTSWVLAYQSFGKEDGLGRKFCKNIEHLCHNFGASCAGLDPLDCVKAVTMALANRLNDVPAGGWDKLLPAPPGHLYARLAAAVDAYYRLNFALAAHEGVYGRLAHSKVQEPPVANCRLYDIGRCRGYYKGPTVKPAPALPWLVAKPRQGSFRF